MGLVYQFSKPEMYGEFEALVFVFRFYTLVLEVIE